MFCVQFFLDGNTDNTYIIKKLNLPLFKNKFTHRDPEV